MSDCKRIDKRTLDKLLSISDWTEKQLPQIELNNHNDFMKVTIEIGNHIRFLLLIGLSLVPSPDTGKETGFEKSKAPIVGFIVRIFKLYDTLSYHVSRNQGDISNIFIRPIWEAYIKMMYLMNNPESTQNFIEGSYKSDKEMYEDLKPKLDKEELDDQGIRILESIERTLKDEELEIEELLLKKSGDWKLDGKTFREIAKEIQPDNFYSFIFGNSSSFIHGDWRDLSTYHLLEEKGKYFPNPEYKDVDPRYLLPVSVICLHAIYNYSLWARTDPDKFFLPIIKTVEDGVRYIDSKHDKWRNSD